MISGEAQKIIVDSGAGWCSDSGDIELAYNNICKILKYDYKELSEKRIKGFQYYNKNFSKNRCFSQLDNIISKL